MRHGYDGVLTYPNKRGGTKQMYPNGIVERLQGRKQREQLLILLPQVRVRVDAVCIDNLSDVQRTDFNHE